MTYDEALDWLRGHYNVEASGLTRAMPTLDRVSALLELLGEPQHQISIIHVTGTNGKGSAARMVVELLTEHGLSVGGYASPHIERINERFTLDNEPVTDETFAEIIAPIANVESLLDVDSAPSYFEVMVAAAFAWFVEAVDVAVVEVGAGGRWDATNVGDGEVAVVTNVALDHLEYFGPTLRDVATEKAGIVKPKSHLVLGETDPSLAAIFLAPANAGAWQREVDFACEDNFVAVGGRSVTLRTPGAIYEDVFLPVHGSHQGDNAAVALAAVEAFFARPADADVVTEAFAKVTAPGRFEVMARHPLVILDGAHNAHGAEAAARTLDEDFSAAGPSDPRGRLQPRSRSHRDARSPRRPPRRASHRMRRRLGARHRRFGGRRCGDRSWRHDRAGVERRRSRRSGHRRRWRGRDGPHRRIAVRGWGSTQPTELTTARC